MNVKVYKTMNGKGNMGKSCGKAVKDRKEDRKGIRYCHFGEQDNMCVPENEWKRPTVDVAIWKEGRRLGLGVVSVGVRGVM